MLAKAPLVEKFCGNLSTSLWEGQSIGFCLSELALHIPASLMLSIISLISMAKISPSLAFEWPFTRWIRLRIVLDVIILIKCALVLLLSMLSVFPAFSNFLLVYATNFGATFVCLSFVTLLDVIHGRVNVLNSRGSRCVLIVEIIYFYISSLQMWSIFSNPLLSKELTATIIFAIDPIFLGFRLLTKVPIVKAVENERITRARLMRQMNFCQVDVTSNRQSHTTVQSIQSETSVGCLKRVMFTWITDTITKGYYGELLSSSTLPLLPKSLYAETLEGILNIEPTVPKRKTKFSVAIPLISQLIINFGKEALILGSIKFTFSIVSLVGPVFLSKFVEQLTQVPTDWKLTLLWGGVLIISRLVGIFLDIAYNYWTPRFGYKVKISVTTLVYQQILKYKASTLSKFSTGNLINLLTSDTERVVNLIPSLNELWAMPVQVVIAIWLLYYQVGVSCFVGVGVLVVLLPINRVITGLIGKFSVELMRHKDLRVKLVSEMLKNMAAVKFACWEFLIRRKVLEMRRRELNALKGQKLLNAVCVFFWAACPALLAGSTFATYVALGNILSPAKVFTSLALFNILIVPMNAFPWVLNGVVEAWISAGRICCLFDVDDVSERITKQHFDVDNNSVESSQTQTSPELILNSQFYWDSIDNPTLTDLNIAISKGQLIGVVGPIASGKTSFLLALMGELKTPEPRQMPVQLNFAYVGFIPWLQKGSIRANILFGESLDPEWLETIIDACGLSEDLKEMPEGLNTEVGESGNRLSGGQKARVALARAVYQRADVYLFDDPLAALDIHVAHSIIRKCIGNSGILSDKTRIIATHRPEWLFDEDDTKFGGPADRVITLSEGRITQQWTPQNERPRSDRDTLKYSIPSTGDTSTTGDLHSEDVIETTNDQTPLLSLQQENDSVINFGSNEGEQSTNWEKFAFGSISSRIYASYFRAVGFLLTLAVLISLILMQASRNAQDYWLSYWMQKSEDNVTTPTLSYIGSHYSLTIVHLHQFFQQQLTSKSVANSTKFYFSVYGGIIGANVVFTVFRAVLFAYAGLRAAANIHRCLLDAVLQGEMYFFDTTPLGRILNRFSSDVGTIDDGLPFLLDIFLAILFSLLGSLVVTCLAMPTVLFMCLPLLFVYWSVQRLYRAAARDLKRLSSISRSPVYAHFSESIGGLVVIRGLHKEAAFRAAACSRLNELTRCELAALAAAAWLNLRLQLIALLVVSSVVLIALLGRSTGVTEVSLAGLAVIYALMLANSMTSLVSTMSDTEKNFVAVERCREITEETPFEDDIVSCSVIAPKRRHSPNYPRFMRRGISACSPVDVLWPKEGHIVFENVHLMYPSATAPTERAAAVGPSEVDNFALVDVSLVVQPGEHVGIVGRTGSGKSSLLRVLLRLVPHLEGPVTDSRVARLKNFRGATGSVKVDGIDVRQVPLNVLRSRILCVSQDPFLFSGTVRENLDPYGAYSDARLVEMLRRSGLVAEENDALALLSSEVGEAGRNLSAGQRQLLCLSRAFFRHDSTRRVICLDEVTASLDDTCEERIQGMLNHEFANSTVLLVAHRLSTVLRCCSRVVVMSFGRIIEEGSPHLLAHDPTTHFHKMLHNYELAP